MVFNAVTSISWLKGLLRCALTPTLAQFLWMSGRYDGRIGRYQLQPLAEPDGGARTVIVDEASMLTEEMFAALMEGLSGVHRLILVGETAHLPPIGAGRPFVDIVAQTSTRRH